MKELFAMMVMCLATLNISAQENEFALTKQGAVVDYLIFIIKHHTLYRGGAYIYTY